MRDELKELKKEILPMLLIFAAAAIMLKIVYYDESIATVARTAAAIYWLFVIPGYAVMFHWRSHLGFAERVAVGVAGAMAVVGVASYYLGLVGLKLQNQTLILPAAVIIISFALAAKFSAGKKQ